MAIPNTPFYNAVEQPTFQRSMRTILTISQADEALITTTFDGTTPGNHDYSTGLIVRLYIPDGFGMVQANHYYGPITVVNDTQFTVPLNTTLFDPFVIPDRNPGGFATPAQVVPIGEVNSILTQATQNVLPYP